MARPWAEDPLVGPLVRSHFRRLPPGGEEHDALLDLIGRVPHGVLTATAEVTVDCDTTRWPVRLRRAIVSAGCQAEVTKICERESP